MNPPIRNLIFDVDGTLLDSKHDIAAAQLHVLESLGVHGRSPQDIFPLIGKPLAEIFTILLPPDLHHRIPEAHTMYVTYYRAHALDSTRLFPGVEFTLAELHRRGIRLAVATTKSTMTTARVLGHFGIAQYFVQVQGSDNIPFKPDPFIINKIVAEQGWERNETVMVGDTDADIAAGRNAGVRTCGVTFGALTRSQIDAASPHLVIDRFDDLIRIVRDGQGS